MRSVFAVYLGIPNAVTGRFMQARYIDRQNCCFSAGYISS
jgi:hypothetical protein